MKDEQIKIGNIPYRTIFNMAERDRLAGCNPIQDSFPITMENGYVWQQFIATCGDCQRDILPKYCRGEVSKVTGDVYLIKAIGLCFHCERCTCYQFNLTANGASGRDKNGNWGTWLPKRYTWWRKLLDKLCGR